MQPFPISQCAELCNCQRWIAERDKGVETRLKWADILLGSRRKGGYQNSLFRFIGKGREEATLKAYQDLWVGKMAVEASSPGPFLVV